MVWISYWVRKKERKIDCAARVPPKTSNAKQCKTPKIANRLLQVFPVISGLVWLATLLGLLLHWIINTHSMFYPSMEPGDTIAYISDIGASTLKPLFITGCVITTIFLDLAFAFDRWLRHKGRLVPNATRGEKTLKALTIVFAIVGTAGLILLSIFDTYRHMRLHRVFLLLFVAGYLLSAVFICWEYQILGKSECPWMFFCAHAPT